MQLAPLIDMVFLLLIFFMVATIFPEDHGIEVEKPNAENPSRLPRQNLLFLVSETGEIWFSGRQVGLEEVSKIVESELVIKPDAMVVVDVDRKSVTDNLIRFLDQARKGGARNLAIGTKKIVDRKDRAAGTGAKK